MALRDSAEAKIAELKRTVALLKSGDRTAALAAVRTGSGKEFMDDVRKNTAAIRETEDTILQRHDANMRQSISTAIGSLAIAALTGLLLVSVAFMLSQRSTAGRLRAAAAIDEQREYLRVTLASIGDGVITTDARGRIDYLNAVAESLTGWSLRAAAGQPLESVFRILNEQTRQPVANPAVAALKQGVVVGLPTIPSC
jgi:PAS domain-containing protein